MALTNTLKTLLSPVDMGAGLHLANRVVMAPLTRCMADDDFVPTQKMLEYYARRSDTGVIISEATLISRDALGYPNQPGIFNQAQITSWRRVTDAVHAGGGKIACQLYHSGRVSHPHYLDGELPVGPSNVPMEGPIPRAKLELEYGPLRALRTDEIGTYIEYHIQAAINAKKAGFDAVEVHAGNGYFLDQFLHWHSNKREDKYGGSPENMSRIVLEVVEKISKHLSIERIGVRVSPAAMYNMEHDSRDVEVAIYLLKELDRLGVAYVHTAVFDDQSPIEYLEGTVTQFLRRYFSGTVIGNGGYTPELANKAIENGICDLVAIGQPMIANPNYIDLITRGDGLVTFEPEMLETLY